MVRYRLRKGLKRRLKLENELLEAKNEARPPKIPHLRALFADTL